MRSLAAAQESEDQEDSPGKDPDADCSLHTCVALLLRRILEGVSDQLVFGPISRGHDLSDCLGYKFSIRRIEPGSELYGSETSVVGYDSPQGLRLTEP